MLARPIFITSFFMLCLITAQSQNAIVKKDSFYSPSVQLQLKYSVILPAEYYKKSKQRYPVAYLLHGHTGNYTSWITYAKLPTQLATQYNCIIILPDGGNSWYVNWSGQTDGKPHLWEDMLVKDLIPEVDKKFRTVNDKKHRAIGGLSMGGFGAISIGLKNSNLFGFVFSSAGALNFCHDIKSEMQRDTLDWNSPQLWSDDKKVVDSKGFSNAKERTPQGLVFKTKEDADKYDPFLLLQKIDSASLPYMHIDCGNRDYHLKAALRFIEEVKQKTQAYSFSIMPGVHQVPYWEQSIVHTFLVMRQQGFLNKEKLSSSSIKKLEK